MNSLNLHKKISVNSLANLVCYAVYVAATFFLTPYTINKIGLDHYGLWVLVLAIVGYGGLFEMGVQTSVIKMVAQKNAANDMEGMNRIVSTAYAFFQAVGLLIAFALIVVLPFFVSKFVSSHEDQNTVCLLFFILGCNAAVCFPSYVLSGVIFGMQRYVAKSFIDICIAVTNVWLTFAVLDRGHGIAGLAFVKIFVDIMSIFAFFLLTRKILPDLRIRVREVSVASFREIFNLGGKIFISSTTSRIATSTEPVLISFILSNSWTSVFSVPKRLVDYVKAISITATTGFMPMFSDLEERGDMSRIADLYMQYTRYIFISVIPFISAIIVLGLPFLRLWVGDDIASRGGSLLFYLAVAFLFDTFQPLVWRLMIGVGRVDFLVKVSAINSMVYLVFAACLVRILGVDGIGISALIISVVNQIFYLPHVCKFLGISPVKYVAYCHLRPFVGWFVFTCVLYGLSFFIGSENYIQFFLTICIGFFFYGVFVYAVVLLHEERSALFERIKTLLLNIKCIA